jgi:hypothetical protein
MCHGKGFQDKLRGKKPQKILLERRKERRKY